MSDTAGGKDYEALMRRAVGELRELRAEVEASRRARSEPIAVIGLGCRFPGGATSPDAFWEALRGGVDGIVEVPPDRWNVDDYYDPDPQAPGKMCTREAGFVDDLFGFDSRFFGIVPREAEKMDPQQRMLLEVSHEALEHANIPVDRLYRSRTGVFVGISTFDAALVQLDTGDAAAIDPYVGTGSTLSCAAGRLSYVLGLTGPSLSIDTACSSSLVALHYACMSLRGGESELALVGGVNALISPTPSINFSQAGMLSPDGRCKTFDAGANGYVRGEGCGVLVLKRLRDAQADGDQVLALIRGSAVNQDGPSGGLTVPNGVSQVDVIKKSLAAGGVAPADVGYVEAHGTGTSLGDPIEIGALVSALCEDRPPEHPLKVGSVKTNIGHCEAAAGVAGIIKVVLSLSHGEIPAHLHFREPNPHIDWSKIPVEVTSSREPWPEGRPRLAGVSSFGFSGTNAHVTLEAAPTTPSPDPETTAAVAEPPFLLPLSAKSPGALAALAGRVAERFASQPNVDLGAACRTAALARTHHSCRLALTAGSAAEMSSRLLTATRAEHPPPRGAGEVGVAFLFTGQGAQYPGMGAELARREPVFRDALHRADEILREPLGESILAVMHGDDRERLDRTELTQPALFALEYALLELWRSWGVAPAAVLGHSVGEYVAALAAGAFELEDALRLIAVRGRLMARVDGTMAAVFCDESTAARAIEPYRDAVAISAVNGPELVVISGGDEEVEAALRELRAGGVEHQPLRVSGAFHSPRVRPLIAELREVAEGIAVRPTTLPLASNVTGELLPAGTLLDADYWCRHLGSAVRFADGVQALAAAGYGCLVELGPHPVLSELGREVASGEWVSSLARGRDDSEHALQALGQVYVTGVDVDWQGVHHGRSGELLKLPTYPFEHRSYPIRPPVRPPVSPSASPTASPPKPPPGQDAIMTDVTPSPGRPQASPDRRARLAEQLQASTAQITGMDPAEVDLDADLFALGLDSIMLMRLRQAVEKDHGVALSMTDLQKLASLSGIAEVLDESLPADAVAASAPAAEAPAAPPPVGGAPAPLGAPLAAPLGGSPAIAGDGELAALFARQLELMNRQVELLAGAGVAPQEMPVLPGAVAAPPAASLPTGEPPEATSPSAAPAAATPVRPASLPYRRLGTGGERQVDERQAAHVAELAARYGAKTRTSKEHTQSHRAVLANIRNVAGFRREWKEMIYQIIADRAEGAHVTDVDGRDYIDITMGFGVYLFGHRPKFVVDAVRDTLERGLPIGPMCGDTGDVARRIHEMVGVDRVAFFNTGSEAVMSAVRLARAVTGRPKVVMFAGSYHGHTDNLLATGHGSDTLPMVPGTPQGIVEDTMVLTYGADESLEVIEAHGHEIAAVLVEPVQSRRPDFQPKEFLRRLREVTARTETALVFDEVILGFRLLQGGAQEWYGIEADMVTYGKAVGGGLPIGIVAGKARFLDAIDGGMWRFGDDSVPPRENTFVAGTFNHHPLAMAAAKAVLQHLQEAGPELQLELNRRTAELARRLDAVFQEAGAPISVSYFGSLFRFELRGDWELFWFHLADRGVYVWEGRNCFLSTAHTDEDLDFIVQAARDSVAEMLAAGASRATDAKPATAAGEPERLPATAGQNRLYVQGQLEGGELAYHVPIALVVEGPLSESRLSAALEETVKRHEALRTSFEMQGDEVLQVIHPTVDLAVERVAPAGRALPDAIVEFIRPFDLSRAPLLRVGLGELPGGKHLLLIDAHHIVFDGISGSIFFDELLRRMLGDTPPEKVTDFRRYVAEEKAYLQSPDRQRDEGYWRDLFADAPAIAELPSDRPRPASKSYEGLRIFRRVSSTETAALKTFARERKTSLNMVLLAAHFTMLHKLTGAEELVVGTAFDGRSDEEMRGVIGTFVNTIAIRGRTTPHTTFAELLAELKERTLEAHDHQQYPFEILVEQLDLKRARNRNPLFDTLFVYEFLETARIEADGLTFVSQDVPNRTAILDITHDVVEVDGALNMSMEFDTDLFDRETVEGFLDRYVRILRCLIAAGAADLPLQRFDVLSPEERWEQLERFNATTRKTPAATFVEVFEASVARAPSATAIIDGDREVTYEELNRRANRLAHFLIAEGAGAERIIGIALERSADMIVAMLAVWKSGAAYLPLDLDVPLPRLADVLEDADPLTILCTPQFAARIPAAVPTCVVDEAFTGERLAGYPDRDPADSDRGEPLAAEHPAYVITTSGSTGKPKGVVVTGRGLPGLAASHVEHFRVTPSSRVLQFAAFTFDAAVVEIITALAGGAALVLVPEDRRVGAPLVEVLERHGVTHLTAPPVVLSTLPDDAELPVECLAVAGEACRPELVRRWAPGRRMFNVYGPTEATVAATLAGPLSAELVDVPPIGLPLWNTRAYVLDDALEPVPAGVVGELYLAGDGLARGYLKRPALTAERFVPDPHAATPGARMYRTGDLARRRSDGNLEFAGRADEQVKLRGFRIEPGEIEAALLARDEVAHAAVILREDHPGERALVGYVVPADGATLDVAQLRHELAECLPEYMVPAAIVELAQLPLRRTGKLDKERLPAPHTLEESEPTEVAGPRNEVEAVLVEVWEQVLRKEHVGIHDSFFDLGGDSIKALQVVVRLQQRGYKLKARDLFDHAELAELAGKIRAVSSQVSQEPVTGDVPLTPIQSWFFAERLPKPEHYDQWVALRARERIDESALRQALGALQTHHDALRLCFRLESDPPEQWIAGQQMDVALHVVDLPDVKADDASALEPRFQEVHAGFDLARGPLLQAALYRLADEDVVLVAAHHLVVDAVSFRILLEDLQSGYDAIVAGRAPGLPAKTHSFQAYARRLHELAAAGRFEAERATWERLLAEDAAPLPGDPQAPDLSADAVCATRQLAGHSPGQITEAATRLDSTVEELLLTALARALQQAFGARRTLVTLEHHGRSEGEGLPDVSRTVGWFTTHYPVALELPEGMEPAAALEHVRSILAQVPERGLGYGALRYLADPPLVVSGRPRVLFNYLGDVEVDDDDSRFALLDSGGASSPQNPRDHELEVEAALSSQGLELRLTYGARRHDPNSMTRLLDTLAAEVGALIERGRSQGVTTTEAASIAAAAGVVTADVAAIYPLSPLQEGMLFHRLLDEDRSAFFNQFAFPLTGDLDVSAFRQSWNQVMARHEAMRAVFVHQGVDRPVQVILREREIPFHHEDLRALDADAQAARIAEFRADDRAQGFALDRDVLFRLAVLQTSDRDYTVVLSFHHILFDGWCMAPLFLEMVECYRARTRGGEPSLSEPVPFSRYARWLEQRDVEASRSFWREYLDGFARPTGLARRSGAASSGERRTLVCELRTEETARLSATAASERVTTSSVLCAAWSLLIGKEDASDDVAFGVVVSGRPAEIEGVEDLIGMFINTVPLRLRIDPAQGFAELARNMQDSWLDTEPHRHISLAEIQSASELGNELLDHALVFENYPLAQGLEHIRTQLSGLFDIGEVDAVDRANYPLMVEAHPGEKLQILVTYDPGVYDESRMLLVRDQLVGLLSSVATAPDTTVRELQERLMSTRERQERAEFAQSLKTVSEDF